MTAIVVYNHNREAFKPSYHSDVIDEKVTEQYNALEAGVARRQILPRVWAIFKVALRALETAYNTSIGALKVVIGILSWDESETFGKGLRQMGTGLYHLLFTSVAIVQLPLTLFKPAIVYKNS